MKENCFELAKNASRRPRGWKSCLNGNESSNVASDEDDIAFEGNEFVLMTLEDDAEETCKFVLPNEAVNLNGDEDASSDWPTSTESLSVQHDHLHTGELEGTCHHGPETGEEGSAPGAATQQEEAEPPQDQQDQQAAQNVARAAQAEDPEDDDSSNSNPWAEHGIEVRCIQAFNHEVGTGIIKINRDIRNQLNV